MAAMTEIESFANLTLNDGGLKAEEDFSKEELDAIGRDEDTIISDKRLLKALNSSDQKLRLSAAIGVRRLSQSEIQPIATRIQPILDAGILPAIIDLLSSDDRGLLYEATWILVNITAGSTEQTAEVVEAGALPKLVPLFPVSPDNIKENILMIAGNILGDSKHLRLVGIREGGFKLALDVLRAPEDYSTGCVGTAAWVTATASSLEHGGFPDDGLAAEMTLVLTTFIQNQRANLSESFREAVSALRRLAAHRDITNAISERGITCQLVQICTEGNKYSREDALRLLIQIGGGGVDSVRAMMGSSCLGGLSDSRDAEPLGSRGTTCSAPEYTGPKWDKALMEFPLLPRILQILPDPGSTEEQEFRVGPTMDPARLAAINLETLDRMVEADYLEALSQALLSDDRRRIGVNLHALEQILNAKWDGRQRAVDRFTASGGPGRLRDLRASRNTRKTEAASVARRVLQTHFPEFSKWPRV
ncbi:Importin subunit alpha-1 [Tulasnella sp. 417]|nr:Importin subunit alpha-1 [Tulasnella sp. 417]